MRLKTFDDQEFRYRPLPMEQCCGICDGVERTWKEYIPSCYDGSERLPLVISLHGGALKPGTMHTGERSNAFTHAAEAHGFIVAYAQSVVDGICWNVWELYGDEYGMHYADDIAYLDWLIDTMCEKYAIDESRVYLYGHSYGDVMATEYALKRSDRLAAAALFCGPSNASTFTNSDGTFRFGRSSALPVLRFHGSEDLDTPSGRWPHAAERVLSHCNPARTMIEEDGGVTDRVRRLKMELTQMPNILLWREVNGAAGVPQIGILGDLDVARYEGDCEFIYACLEGGGHFPPVWAAEWIWRHFFSRHANIDGRRERLSPEAGLSIDTSAVFFAEGAQAALCDGALEGLAKPVLGSADGLLVAREDAVRLVGAGALMADAANAADGYVSLKQCAACSGLRAFELGGVACVSERKGALSYDIRYLIRACLGVERAITPRDCLEIEAKQLIKHGLEPLI